MFSLRDLPEFREAAEEERRIRQEAWLEIEDPVCGIEVVPLNLERLTLLELAGNAFVSTYAAGIAVYDICLFLWIVSKDFIPGDIEARNRFFSEKTAAIPAEEAIAGIGEYIAKTFFDLPGGGSANHTAPQTDWLANMCHSFAAHYGWSIEYVRRKPLRQLYQLYRCIMLENDAKAKNKLANPLSDKVVTDFLTKANARN